MYKIKLDERQMKNLKNLLGNKISGLNAAEAMAFTELYQVINATKEEVEVENEEAK